MVCAVRTLAAITAHQKCSPKVGSTTTYAAITHSQGCKAEFCDECVRMDVAKATGKTIARKDTARLLNNLRCCSRRESAPKKAAERMGEALKQEPVVLGTSVAGPARTLTN
eukprot:TRINITY_DN850_c0_g1_i9.p3 TRINITY_DN850_c0_g1~~TRINITY_DN850_c0_g1_i9.p3  ORF type:complete len:111 (+),score=4.46 TRINITY_DN850_c0_g1_i9:473-805(+)